MASMLTKPFGTKDRRVAQRRQPTVGTVCHLANKDGDNLGMGLVWNLSNSGISMLFNQSLNSGANLLAQLSTMDAEYSLPLTLRVAHVSQLATGDFIIGGQFSRMLTDEEMRHFVA